jgi:endonuclease/exonuclease/phosphatase family metal-dependent hydrolase
MFSITTFNVLADVNIKIYPQMYEELILEGPKCREEVKSYDEHIKVDEVLEKTNRYIKIIEQLNDLKSDIFCLQEVQEDFYDYLLIFAKMNNYYITDIYLTYTGKSDIEGYFPKNGLVNLLSKNKFNNFIEKSVSTVNDRNLLLSHFNDENNKKYALFNCHLSCSEKSSIEGSGEKELDYLINLVKNHKNKICLVCGDFNNHPFYTLDKIKYKGHIWKMIEELGMEDSYLMKGFTYSNKYQFKPMKKFDYIFYFNDQLFKKSIKWLKLPEYNVIETNKKNSKTTLKWFLENFGSDHQPLTTIFQNVIDHGININNILQLF